MKYDFSVRVTGILMENQKILLVKQKLSETRAWSLPGDRLEQGETLEQCLRREMKEETGLDVDVGPLLYLCDTEHTAFKMLHITFLLTRKGGDIVLPTNEWDDNPIHDVRFVPVSELADYGFSEVFVQLALHGFPNKGSYMGDKKNIGLGI